MIALVWVLACRPTVDTGDTVDTDVVIVDLDGDGSAAADDCDDANPDVHPGATELCNAVDDDCDGLIPGEGDVDGDGALDCAACAAAGYWSVTQNVEGDALIAALHAATDGVTCTYDTSREFLFTTLDNVEGTVTCVYTGKTFAITTYPPDWTQVNTEHTWPQSMGADVEPAKCDLHHLYVADADANNKRGNTDFGVVTGTVDLSEGG